MAFVTILGAMTLVTATPVPADLVRTTVSYADLDLQTEAGRAALEARVSRAARRICGSVRTADLHATMAAQACRASAQSRARPQINLALARARNPVRVAAR